VIPDAVELPPYLSVLDYPSDRGSVEHARRRGAADHVIRERPGTPSRLARS
jgi:hypothetical protein